MGWKTAAVYSVRAQMINLQGPIFHDLLLTITHLPTRAQGNKMHRRGDRQRDLGGRIGQSRRHRTGRGTQYFLGPLAARRDRYSLTIADPT